jgi:hypothetical protein
MEEVSVGKSKISIYKDSSCDTKKDSDVYLDVNDSCDNDVYLEEIDINKVNDDSHLVFGWANVALHADGEPVFDWEGDITAPRVLEKAAYSFVLKYRETGEMHKGKAKGYLVESVMFTKQKIASIGIPEGIIPEGWWVGFYIPDDEVCAKVKSGEYKMFSIQGKAKRLKV